MLLDVGCGNGKYMGHNKQVFQVRMYKESVVKSVCCRKELPERGVGSVKVGQ